MTFFETLALFGQHLRYLCQKELITIFKDPRMQFMLVMPVIIQGFIFGYAANYTSIACPMPSLTNRIAAVPATIWPAFQGLRPLN